MILDDETTMSDCSTTRLQDHRTEDNASTRCSQPPSPGYGVPGWSVITSQPARRSPWLAVDQRRRLGVGGSSSREGAPCHAVARRLRGEGGFTLVELVVTMGVLVLLVFLFTQLLNSSANITILGHKQMDTDSQARQVLDRIAIDFAQMVKRPDVDYYLKSSSGSASDCGVCNVHDQDGWTGNDQAAFYSTVPGYYPTPTASPIAASPVSLVSYRVNSDSTSSSYNKLERMGKSLAWNGVSTGLTPVVFLPQTISVNWPSAISSSMADPDGNYETVGPQVFRFEYYYLLKGQTAQVGAPTPTPTANPTIFSDTPWISGNTNVVRIINGVISCDVTAIIVDIAVIEPKSRALIDNSAQVRPPNDNITLLGAQLIDWGSASCSGCQWQTTPGLLASQWRAAIDANTIGLPKPAISGIRVYERYFYLNQ